ncbi:MAG: GNAT family N-acetyltransferase [Rhizobiales bacterium]|nr:GNAT family N-acetyltransferase [Hyphomicrobiales bacterium]
MATSTRPITVADLEQVIAIDKVSTGSSRRHFFEKRFAAAKRRPNDFVQIGVVDGDALRGFAIARILRGEFGQKDAIAVVDALGVAPESREHGLGHRLIDGLVESARAQGAHSVQSLVDWKNPALLRFFNTTHFQVAPRMALECAMGELRAEANEEP